MMILAISACHPISHVDLDTSVPPAVPPSTEMEYLIAQNQLPRNLRGIDTDSIILKTVDPRGKSHQIITSEHDQEIINAPQTSTTELSIANNQLSVNPARCRAAANSDPFPGTKASEEWMVQSTQYNSTVTAQPLPLEKIAYMLKSCAHIQVHNKDSISTRDRKYSFIKLAGRNILQEESTNVIVHEEISSNRTSPSIAFSLRYIVTLAKATIQVSLLQNTPLTEQDTAKLNTLLSRQINNIPDE